MNEPPIKNEMTRLHDLSSNNRHSLSGSALAGCFYCREIWVPSEHRVREWTDVDEETGNATAICPFCSIDSVLASLDIWPLTKEMLQKMYEYWFCTEGGS